MTWRPHLESGPKALLPSLRKCIGSLKFLGKKMPANCRNTLVKGLETSRLSYLLSVWGGTTGNLQRKAQITLNIAARWVTRFPKRTRVSDLMAAAGWLDIEEMTLHSVGVLMCKLINKRTPLQLFEKISWDANTNQIFINEPRIQFSNQEFLLRGCRLWNELPEHMRDGLELSCFKRQFKSWLMERRQLEPD